MTAGLSLNTVILNDPQLWHSTHYTMNGANVAAYSIDSAGLHPPRGYLAEMPTTSRLPAGIGRSPMKQTQILDAISAETGGLSLKNTNNLAAGFTHALADSRSFYHLTYRTANIGRASSLVRWNLSHNSAATAFSPRPLTARSKPWLPVRAPRPPHRRLAGIHAAPHHRTWRHHA